MFIAFWRTLVLYLSVIVALRFMGKRQIGELQPSELVTTIMISNIAAIPIENMDTPLLNGLIPVVLLACFEVLSSALALKSRRVRQWVMGHPRPIIANGTIDQAQLRRIRWSIDDLVEQLRGAGVFDISEVDFATVETNGKLSVYQKFDNRNIIRKDLLIPQDGNDSPPAIVISDGEVLSSSLTYCNLSREWLDKILAAEQHTPGDIFLMSCDRAAQYKIILREGVR